MNVEKETSQYYGLSDAKWSKIDADIKANGIHAKSLVKLFKNMQKEDPERFQKEYQEKSVEAFKRLQIELNNKRENEDEDLDE